MAVYFNDLTIVKDDPQQNCRLLPEFFKVMKSLRAATEDREKRVFVNDDAAPLWEAVYSSGNQDLIQKYSSVFKLPFQDDEAKSLMGQAKEHADIEAEYNIKTDSGAPVGCNMMGWAEHEISMTMGLASSKTWIKSPVHEMTISEFDEQGEIVEQTMSGICVVQEQQLKDPYVLERLDDMRDMRTLYVHGDEETCCPDQTGLPARGRIIVIGAHNIAPLKELARNVGFDDSRFEFIEYQKVSNLESDSWRNSGSISAIMCGPVPHSGGGMGDVSSFVRSLKRPGFPPLQELKKSMGKLAVTRQSFKLGLMCLMKKGAIVINKV